MYVTAHHFAKSQADKNLVELCGEYSALVQARYLGVFVKFIALAGVREQAACICGRFEQVRMQEMGGPGPSRQAKVL